MQGMICTLAPQCLQQAHHLAVLAETGTLVYAYKYINFCTEIYIKYFLKITLQVSTFNVTRN